MGFVSRRGQRWVVNFTNEHGKRKRRSLRGIENKTQAKLVLAELEAAVSRRLLGLEASPVTTFITVWGVCEWWLANRCPKQSFKKEKSRLQKHVRETELGSIVAGKATPDDFEAYFAAMEKADAAPAQINNLRAVLRGAFNRAIQASPPIFTGQNPLLKTKARKVSKKFHATLSAEEVAPLLRCVKPQWRNFFAAAIYLGLRKGELAGVLKTDVDAQARTLDVARSYKRETTKGGHSDRLPIPEPLWPYVEKALETKGPYLFPSPKGFMRKESSRVGERLKTALKAAGLVTGYKLTCRRCKKDKGEITKLPDERPLCKTCGMLLWVTAKPRPMRFHDLRHSTATILLRVGVPYQHVQKIMRHKDIRTTISTYAHLVVEDLRQAQFDAWSKKDATNLPQSEAEQQTPIREGTG